MHDFSHLNKLTPKAEPRPFTFNRIVGEPVLHVLPATEENRPYWTAIMRRVQRAMRVRASKADAVAAQRAEDRELYAKHVIRGWDRVVDAQGRPVPFSAEACLQWLEALPTWLFDDLRNWCANPANFIEDDSPIEPEEAEELGEGSPSA